jgi:tetratricopeptide (TPR) repeat protein
MVKSLLVVITILSVSGTCFSQQAEEFFETGIKFWEQRNYDSALFSFDQVIQIDPFFREAFKYRAECRAMKNDIEGAILDYRIYLGWYPDEQEALFSYSELNYREEHYQQALEGFLKLKELPQGSTSRVYYVQKPGQQGVSTMFTAQTHDRSFLDNYLGLTYRGMGDYSRSVMHFDSALAIRPDDTDYLTNMAITYRQMDKRTAAFDMLNKVLKLEPGHPLAKQHLASMIREDGNQEEAIRLYSETISQNPGSSLGYENRGYAHLLKGDNRKAIADFDDAIRRNPKEATSWLNRGIALMRLDLLEEAFSDFSKAIELEPSFASAYLNRGNALYRLGEYADALNDYAVAIIYDKTYYLAYYHRGITQYKLGDKEGACASLRFAAVNNLDVAKKTLRQICPD